MFFNFQIEILVDNEVTISLANAFAGGYSLSAALRLRELKGYGGIRAFGSLDALHFFQLLDSSLGLCGLGCLCSKSRNE